DSGAGIALDDQQAIFEPFRQVGDRLHHGEGTGLGLSISSHLVELMGGKLQVISPLAREFEEKEGPGSRFFFTLQVPILHDARGEDSDLSGQIITGYISLEDPGKKQTILVVDDIASNRAVLRDILQAVGFIVYESEDGQNIVNVCRAVRPDLILIDLLMPGTNGLTAGLQVKRDKDLAYIPMIAISALVTERKGLQRQCVAHGFRDVLGKPCSVRKLLETLAKHLPITLRYDEKKEVTDPEDYIVPLPAVLDELAALVEIGDIKRISQKITELCAMDAGRYSVFCHHLKKYFDEFQFTGLLNFIAANRSKKLCQENKMQYS
ncbi:MAG: response regulator, partial [Candidatus Electrothrix sp. AUS4]|nr:response regulator [Candidatus Electrothrix sp. AUS4]